MIKRQKGTNKKTGLYKMLIEGDMTIYMAEVLKKELDPILADYSKFEFDLSHVEDIDSSGVQILLTFAKATKAQDKTFSITASNAEVDKIINAYHLSDVLAVA